MSNEQRVMSFRKKPLVIQAMRLVDDPSDAYVDELHKFMEDCVWSSTNGGIAIDTMEGTMHASPGDWIIRGIGGEYYPCKPEIFAVSYEPAKSAQQVPADGEPGRFFASGPGRHFYTDDAKFAEILIGGLGDADDWTLTNLAATPQAPQPEPDGGGVFHSMINHEREPHCIGCYVIHCNRGYPFAKCNECGFKVPLLHCLNPQPELPKSAGIGSKSVDGDVAWALEWLWSQAKPCSAEKREFLDLIDEACAAYSANTGGNG